MSALVGMWVMITDIDHWKSGFVEDDLGNGFYLVKVDITKDSPNPVKNIYDVVGIHKYDVLATEHEWVGITAFDNEHDLRKYIEWIETTPNPNDKKPKKEEKKEKEKVIKLFPKDEKDE